MVDSECVFKDTRFLEVYSTKYVLKNNNMPEQITIKRGHELVLNKEINKEEDGVKLKTVGIKAVYGIFKLRRGNYLAVVTKANFTGQIYLRRIFQIDRVEFFPLSNQDTYPTNDKEDEVYITMLNSIFKTKFFYFSYDYDLTNSLQKFEANQFNCLKFNERFCFNEHCMKEFLALGADEWITPIISGIVQISYTNLISNNNLPCEITLISRRDKSRTGMRYVSRGADVDGNVSNFAETEQIIQISQDTVRENPIVLYSFLQTRGSMPFLWQQKPDMKWEPKGAILGGDNENISVCQKHFETQVKDYGPQTIVNLIDKKGFQLHVGEYFEKMVKSCQNEALRYVWFDFHMECRNMKYENLSKLVGKIKEDLEKMGWFQLSYYKSKPNNYNVDNKQRGVVRTNCMDCLDRTNVTQSVLARWVLHKILVKANLSQTNQPTTFEKFSEELETIFREIWTKNADVLSILYTGTGALKTDFTRLGKKTAMGNLKDGQNSIMRYFLNHFYDGYKQNCVDLLVGKLNPSITSYKPKKMNSAVGMALCMVIIPIVLVLFVKRSAITHGTNWNENLISGVVVVVFTLLFGKILQANNKKWIEKPLLKC